MLEKKGYVQRVEEPLNRRSHRLALTSQGVDALQTSDHLWAQILEGQFENWSAKDRESFLALLRKYNESSRTNTKRLQPREGHSPKK